MDNERPVLYRAITCNFCHRSEIAFAAKGIEIETIDIDLVRRPEWYGAKASGGSVPLLEWNGHEIHPSTVINEFVEENWPEPALFPDDPFERAAARSWIEWFNDGPCPAYERRLMNVRPERDEMLNDALVGALEEMEAKLTARGYESGYWHGDRLGVVDATTAPMFVRFAGLWHFHGFDIPADLGRVRSWRDALLADPHVRNTSPDEDTLLAAYEGYRKVLTRAAEAGIEVPVAKGD
ncbi:MAG: glutathione S-transferase family protein [Acidobacteria bacterium]|nr:glutathione S-transferase family protein [Acidobacteriota bacterium]